MAAWYELLASVAAGGGAARAFDWLRARGRQKLDAREQLDGSIAAHLLRLDAEIRDLRSELSETKRELESERAGRISAEARAEAAELEVASLLNINRAMRQEVRLMRVALVGTEVEKIEALAILAKIESVDVDETAPHRAVKP